MFKNSGFEDPRGILSLSFPSYLLRETACRYSSPVLRLLGRTTAVLVSESLCSQPEVPTFKTFVITEEPRADGTS